jgi:hypothetical protein
MKEFTIGGNTYSAERLDAFTQLHIGRRLAPALADVTAESGSLISIITALSSATQSDVDFIIKSALKVVKRQSGGAWAAVYNAPADRMAFEDINGAQLVEIAAMAIKDDIAPFFSGLVKLVLGTSEPTSA